MCLRLLGVSPNIGYMRSDTFCYTYVRKKFLSLDVTVVCEDGFFKGLVRVACRDDEESFLRLPDTRGVPLRSLIGRRG